jgi:hypothetical protein
MPVDGMGTVPRAAHPHGIPQATHTPGKPQHTPLESMSYIHCQSLSLCVIPAKAGIQETQGLGTGCLLAQA